MDDLGPFNEAAGVFGRKGSFPSTFTPQKINGWNLTSDTPGKTVLILMVDGSSPCNLPTAIQCKGLYTYAYLYTLYIHTCQT